MISARNLRKELVSKYKRGYSLSYEAETLIGCSLHEFIKHIDSKRTLAMTRKNVCDTWTITHILNEQLAGSIKVYSHYTNFYPVAKNEDGIATVPRMVLLKALADVHGYVLKRKTTMIDITTATVGTGTNVIDITMDVDANVGTDANVNASTVKNKVDSSATRVLRNTKRKKYEESSEESLEIVDESDDSLISSRSSDNEFVSGDASESSGSSDEFASDDE